MAKTGQVAGGCVRAAALCALAGALVAGACEGPPARSKPWRHLPDVPPGVAGAGQSPAALLARARAAAEAVRAHTLRIQLRAEPDSLYPLLDPDRETLEVVEDTIYEPLLRHTPAGYQPALAESFRIAGNVIRFALRKDVVFHDGRPFTAVDAQHAIEAARRPSSHDARLRAELADIVSVDVWGPRDLRVVLARPNSYVLRALAEVPIFPAAASPGALRTAPIGTGPYRFVRWVRGDRIVLARFDRYWGPAPAIPDVEMRIVPDGAQALLMIKRGDLDILPALIPEHWPEQANAPGMAAAFAPLELAPPRFQAVVLNVRDEPFDDARVRRAAGMLVDRARIAREAWRGLARPIAGPVWPGGPGDAQSPAPPPYDPARAMRLLEDAGWKPDRDGVRVRDGAKLRVRLLAERLPSEDAVRDLVVAGLRGGGFGVNVKLVGASDFLAALRDGDHELALIDYGGRVDEDLAPFFVARGARNWSGLSSPAVSALCAELRGEWDPAERRPIVGQLGILIAAEAPFIPLVAPEPHGLVARRVQGVVVHDGWFAIRDLRLSR